LIWLVLLFEDGVDLVLHLNPPVLFIDINGLIRLTLGRPEVLRLLLLGFFHPDPSFLLPPLLFLLDFSHLLHEICDLLFMQDFLIFLFLNPIFILSDFLLLAIESPLLAEL
jgi:hypothetical protein